MAASINADNRLNHSCLMLRKLLRYFPNSSPMQSNKSWNNPHNIGTASTAPPIPAPIPAEKESADRAAPIYSASLISTVDDLSISQEVGLLSILAAVSNGELPRLLSFLLFFSSFTAPTAIYVPSIIRRTEPMTFPIYSGKSLPIIPPIKAAAAVTATDTMHITSFETGGFLIPLSAQLAPMANASILSAAASTSISYKSKVKQLQAKCRYCKTGPAVYILCFIWKACELRIMRNSCKMRKKIFYF